MWFSWFDNRDLFAEMDAFRRQMDALFDAADDARGSGAGGFDWHREGDRYELRFDVPGLRPEDVELSAKGGQLTLNAERKIEAPEGMKARHRERRSWRISRTMTLPEDADADQVTADLRDGVLVIGLPTRPEVQPRRIEVGAR